MTNYLLRWPKSFRGPMMGWRSIFFISAIILGLVLCLEYIYQYIGGEKLGELDAASPSSISKLSEQVESLQQQVTHLQRRFWLEPLEPIWQYRGNYYLGKTSNEEDKDQLTPFLLGNFVDASDKKQYKKRISMDLGAKDFDSSLCWIMQNYPVKFDVMHGFECKTDFTNVAAFKEPIDQCVSGTAAEKMGYTTNGILKMLHTYYNYIGVEDDPATTPPTRGLSQFLQDIGVQEDDFVMLKMDVEGIEFDLLERIMADGTHKLIDEMFVEIHYDHPDMHPFGWQNFEHSRSDAQALLNKARDMGIYIHPWP